ncbi:hypothetical protein V6N13_124282 [Hibiscus sabdariffa]|uniref:Uncharacterized protein n=1 Tax=Hibiscus sabdariffa TaxID=183260 RepID=A0ABR2S1L2_9ROSI
MVVGCSELEGRSLSDSDLPATWDNAIKEAEKAIEMGSKLGVQFIGLIDEVVRDIAELEMKEADPWWWCSSMISIVVGCLIFLFTLPQGSNNS